MCGYFLIKQTSCNSLMCNNMFLPLAPCLVVYTPAIVLPTASPEGSNTRTIYSHECLVRVTRLSDTCDKVHVRFHIRFHRLHVSFGFTRVTRIGREPGPGLRMFSAKFCSLSFPVNLRRGPSQVCNDHSQLGAFCLFGPKIRYIQILCHGGVRYTHRNSILGRKHLQIVEKAIMYYLGAFHKPIP